MNEFALYAHIGRAVRVKREERGWKQDDLAAKVGLLRTSITNLEAGRQRSPIHVIYAIAEALEIDPHELLPHPNQIGQYREIIVNGQKLALTTDEVTALRRQLDGSEA